MPLRLLHVSDIHAKPGDPFDRYNVEIKQALDGAPVDFIAATGDLGLKGKDAEYAATFLLSLATELGLTASSIVCCPGNHDISSKASPGRFAGYLRAMTKLYGDPSGADPTDGSSHKIYDTVGFVSINSAFHGDYTFGRVDLDAVERSLDAIASVETKIVLVHHHLISTILEESEIKNAYELLRLLTARRVKAVLHGHRHMLMRLTVGDETRIIGAGTLNFEPHPDVGRQFNYIEVGRRIVRYRFQADALARTGRSGAWVPQEESW
jgi:3',5'-cyclic AMP phosphodiesterase CpdA